MEQSQTPIPNPTENEARYAGFWTRAAAAILDFHALSIAGAPIVYMISAVSQGSLVSAESIFAAMGFFPIWFVLIIALYFVLMTHFFGATLGKMAVGLSVQSVGGGRLSMGKVLLREIVGKFINNITLNIGYIIAAFTDQKRGLHDYVAGSVVTYTDPVRGSRKWVVIAVLIWQALGILLLAGFFFTIGAGLLALGGAASDKFKEGVESGAIDLTVNGEKVTSFDEDYAMDVSRDDIEVEQSTQVDVAPEITANNVQYEKLWSSEKMVGKKVIEDGRLISITAGDDLWDIDLGFDAEYAVGQKASASTNARYKGDVPAEFYVAVVYRDETRQLERKNNQQGIQTGAEPADWPGGLSAFDLTSETNYGSQTFKEAGVYSVTKSLYSCNYLLDKIGKDCSTAIPIDEVLALEPRSSKTVYIYVGQESISEAQEESVKQVGTQNDCGQSNQK